MASAEKIEVDEPSYRFGLFELNVRRRQLLRGGRPVSIQPKPFDLLLYLIRNRDRLVTRDELLAAVWRGVHVDDEALRFTLHTARKAVDDDGVRQRVIRTVPRSGFRLVAAVEELPSSRARDAGVRARLKPEAPRTPFLGRESLVAEVRRLLADVAGGASRVLFICGEAGIGKTRAMEEIAYLAKEQGLTFLLGRCVESEGTPAFWPWVEILRAAAESNPPAELLRELSAGAREVARMVPELHPFVEELPEAPALEPRAARFLLFDSVGEFFKGLAGTGPFVVAIDDLHRADATSAALFQHVAREIGQPGPRLLLIGAYREGELRSTPPVADPLVAVAALPHSRHARLSGLEPGDVATLVQLQSGRVPSEAVVADLQQKTSGNPFFVNQILRVLASESRLTELDSEQNLELELPRHVQDLVRRQLQVLPEPVRGLLEIASVSGGDFKLAELELASELERSELLARLGVAMEAGIVAPRPNDPNRHRFTHALVRDAVYAGLALDLRAGLHARVARALERLVPEGPSAESASIAHHYSRAARREDVQRAVHFYELAASWSTARGAFEDAPDFVDRALELLDQTRPDASLRKCRLMLQLGDALTNAGERERAREVLLNAAQIAEQRDLRQEIVAAALRFAPDFLAIESGVYDFELVDLIERAIVALGDSAPALRARLLARLAIALQWNRDQAPRRRDLWDEARLIASAVDDIETKEFVTTVGSLMDFDSLRSFSSSGTEPQPLFQQRNRAVSASLELLRGLARITSLIIRGHIDKADEEILLFAELAERSKHPQARWYVELMRATRAQMDGRFDEAHERGLRFLELGRRYADRNAIHSYEAQQVMRAFDVGAIEAYEARMRAMVAAFPRMVAWRAGLALLLLELNRVEEARSELTRVVGAGALTGLSPNEWYVTTAALALTCGRIGDRALAAETYSLLLPHADELVVFGYCTYCLGSTHRLLATLASHMGQWEVASSHFDSAIARNLAAGSRVSNARVHYERALMLRAAGRESEALRAAGQAERIAVEFGMVRLAGQCCALVELD